MIYLDNAATTKMHPEVVHAMLPYMANRYANPSGSYSFAKNIKNDIESARAFLASTINAKPEEIIFTSGGSESDNMALKMVAKERAGALITSAIEHKAIINSAKELEQNGRKIYTVYPNEKGIVEAETIKHQIEMVKQMEGLQSQQKNMQPVMISVMTANNEIGTIQPIQEIGTVARQYHLLFHTDAVQAYTNVAIDVEQMCIDLLSVSGHKLRGPKGIGFLYVREGTIHTPMIQGGGQEFGMRAGTENVAGIIGLAAAARIAMKNRANRIAKEIYMRDYMIKRILSEMEGAVLNGDPKRRLPNNMNITFPGVDGATLILMLDQQGICASAGSACSSASTHPSHVLTAIGKSNVQAYSTIRFTLNEELSKEEADYVIRCLKGNVEQLKKISQQD